MEATADDTKILNVHIKTNWEGGIKTTSLMRGFEIVADAPKWKYGTNSAPAPGEIFLASISACFTSTFTRCAQEDRLILDAVYTDIYGHITHEYTGREKIDKIEMNLKAYADEKYRDSLQSCFDEARTRCPLTNAVKCDIEIKFTFVKERD